MFILSLGQKIQFYRQALELSQLDVEIAIGASPGTISRIESGKVNPTKETINKLIKALKLNSIEAADLYEIELKEIPDLLSAINEIHNSKDRRDLLQKAVDLPVFILDLFGAASFVVKNDKLFSQTQTDYHFTEVVNSVIHKRFDKLSVPLNDRRKNIVLSSIRQKKSVLGYEIQEVAYPAISKTACKFLQSVFSVKVLISYPLFDDAGNVFGAIVYARSTMNDIAMIHGILTEIARIVAEKYISLSK